MASRSGPPVAPSDSDDVPGGPWAERASHRAWLDGEAGRLVDFARAAVRPAGGFAWLDDHGRPEPDRPLQLLITARMTHVFALAHLRGVPGCGLLVDHGLAALRGPFRDAGHGGWLGALDPDGTPTETDKTAYEHAFVVLAASSAAAAGRAGARSLLEEALTVIEGRFWREDEGRCVERWDRTWRELEPYRGANANMHAVEAFLAAADVTGEDVWRRRGLRIAEHLVHGAARAAGWRLPEHFDAAWRPLPDYNADRPDHPFRPYGSTPGHWLEWSRLLLGLEAALADPPPWLLEDARSLFDAATRLGWSVDGAPGFVYTLGPDDRPVVRARLHWVLCEAIAAGATLRRRTGEARYEAWYRTWWDHAAEVFIDRTRGSWHHELDAANRPAASVWSGKPDVYHALGAVLAPQLPAAPTLAVALRDEAEPVR